MRLVSHIVLAATGALALHCAGPPQAPSPATAETILARYVESIFRERYAPLDLKRQTMSFDLDRELVKLRDVAERSPQGMRRALYETFRAPRDLHTSIHFQNERWVWLGLHVKRTSDGAWRIAWIDRKTLPRDQFVLDVGDEVVSFDSVPIAQAIDATRRAEQWSSTPDFEQAFAEWFLTFRGSGDWPSVPAPGTVAEIGIRRDGVRVVRVPWLDIDQSPPSTRCPFWGKTKESVLPLLGEPTWRSAESSVFPAYVFRSEGRRYGYLRFATYQLAPERQPEALTEVGRFVDEMQRRDVAALVLDQQGNGGGNFVLGYALLSRLTSRPLSTPTQRYLVSGERSVVGFGDESVLTRRAEALRSLADDAAVATFMKEDPLFATALNFVPRTVATSRSAGEFFHFLAERAQGPRGLTAPFYEFQRAVEPGGAPFERPILLLIDELNISAAEYVAAALVDSGRATSLGRTTSGAGGDQRSVVPDRVCPPGRTHAEDPFAECVPPEVAAAMRSIGITSMSYTVTVGQRPSGPIENVGVAPKHGYAVTAEDLRSNFAPMKQRVLDVLSTL